MRGDIVIIDFPFGDGTGWNIRPAVAGQDDSIYSINVAVMLMTSQTNLLRRSRLLIDPTKSNGQGLGLRMTSVAACENFYSPNRNRILSVIGRLPPSTMAKIDE